MQTTDREEFRRQLAMLGAAYDRPVADREDAYWTGLSKMSIVEFGRVVEWCVGEQGPEKLPTTKQCWMILRALKTNASNPGPPKIHKRSRHEAPDNLLFLSNRLLLAHLAARSGLGSAMTFIAGGKSQSHAASPEMLAALRFKADLVMEFAAYVREGDSLATRGEFIRRFVLGLDRVSRLAESAMAKFREVMREQAELLDRPMEPAFVAGIDATAQFDFSDYAAEDDRA